MTPASGPPILIVDDDEDIREMLAIILEAEGDRALTASDGVAALELIAKEGPPALILLDLMMPRMNGEQLLDSLRKDPRLARIPVLVVSGDPSAREKAIQLAVAGCLRKPIELEELLGRVRRLLDAQARR